MSSALSAFFRNLPENIQQPASIAFLGSIAAHAFFFASLPAFTSSQENQTDPLRRVDVIELSPEQQSRLPKIDSSLALSPLQQAPNAKLPPPQIQTTPVPNNPLLYDIPGLSTPVLPDPQAQSSDSNALLRKYIANQNIAIARRREQLKDLTPSETQPKADTPEKADSSSQAIANAINNAPNTQIPFVNPDDPDANFRVSGQPTQPAQPSSPSPSATTPLPPGETASPSPSASTPATPAPSPTATPYAARLLEEQRQLYAYNPSDTDADPRSANSGFKAPNQNWLTWKAENIQEALDRKELALVEHPTKEEELQSGEVPVLPYPISFAIPRFQQNTIVIAATVGTDKNLVGEPVLLGKSGYGALDREAIAYVKEQVKTYPAPEKPTVHRFVFKYEPPKGQAVS